MLYIALCNGCSDCEESENENSRSTKETGGEEGEEESPSLPVLSPFSNSFSNTNTRERNLHVDIVMKPVMNLLCYYVFVSFLEPDRAQRSVAFLSF